MNYRTWVDGIIALVTQVVYHLTWTNQQVWANSKLNSRLVNFVPEITFTIFTIYILRNTHQKAMSQIFIPKWVLAYQKSEQPYSQMKKMIRRCIFRCEKNETSNQRCVSFAPKFPPFIGACSLQRPRSTSCFADIQREKFFPQTSEKHLGNWSGIVSCVSLTMKTIVEIRQNHRGRGKTKRDASLSCAI